MRDLDKKESKKMRQNRDKMEENGVKLRSWEKRKKEVFSLEKLDKMEKMKKIKILKKKEKECLFLDKSNEKRERKLDTIGLIQGYVGVLIFSLFGFHDVYGDRFIEFLLTLGGLI